MAVNSIAISFLVILTAVAVSSGFRHEIRRGLSELSGDVQLLPADMNYLSEASPVSSAPSFLDELRAVDGVEAIEPVVYRGGIVKGGDQIHGVMVKGCARADTTTLGVSIPSKLSALLDLGVGDDLLTYFIGERVKVRKFRITEVYPSMIDSGDDLVVFASLSDMRRLNSWTEGQCSALEIRLSPQFRDEARSRAVAEEVGMMALTHLSEGDDSLVAVPVQQKWPQLFNWLNLIDFNVLFILALMTVVAGFNMISGLLIMLFRNISTIGTLKSMGMTDRNISAVFLRVASSAVLKGMLVGNAVAIALCLVQKWTHVVKLNPENYFVPFVPVHLAPVAIVAADIASYVVIMLLLLIPTLFISHIDPARTVRAQ